MAGKGRHHPRASSLSAGLGGQYAREAMVTGSTFSGGRGAASAAAAAAPAAVTAASSVLDIGDVDEVSGLLLRNES